jgi:hypothetical protein
MLKTKKLTEETRMLRQQQKHKDHRELKNQNGKRRNRKPGTGANQSRGTRINCRER